MPERGGLFSRSVAEVHAGIPHDRTANQEVPGRGRGGDGIILKKFFTYWSHKYEED
jgi:hypothetical protein